VAAPCNGREATFDSTCCNVVRNLPRTIWISIPLITVIYLLVNVAYFSVLSVPQLLQSNAVAVVSNDVIHQSIHPSIHIRLLNDDKTHQIQYKNRNFNTIAYKNNKITIIQFRHKLSVMTSRSKVISIIVIIVIIIIINML